MTTISSRSAVLGSPWSRRRGRRGGHGGRAGADDHPRGRDLGYPAGRTPIDEPAASAAIAAVSSAMGRQPVRYPTLGGSAPFYIFSSRLGVPTVGMPVVNYDNNQHGPNENIRLGAYFDAIRAIRGILLTLQPLQP
jgi:acetylornithine deacetylase/succinyl-diaminopimelate desuccinylase-like protein